MSDAVLKTAHPLQADLARMDDLLRAAPGLESPLLREVLDSVFTSGGKRIRPALVLATVRIGRADAEAALNLAAAVETLHTATLVHDDMVDRSEERRGSPTLMARWGSTTAVLAGDWLFARAARFAAATGNLRVMEIFARTLQVVAEGELRQLFGRRAYPDEDEYERRIYAKTAALFEAATEMAGIVAGLPEPVVEALAVYGRELGMGFQIVDDILDFTGDRRRLGKPVGSDLRTGTVTLPVIRHLARRGGSADMPPLEEDLDRLAASVAADDGALHEAWSAADARLQAAIQALERVPGGPARDLLARLGHDAVERDA